VAGVPRHAGHRGDHPDRPDPRAGLRRDQPRDIAAPRCFTIEKRLRELLDIPVFHDDQHGTAVVVLGALRNALRVVGKELADCRIVVCGAGAGGSAIIRLLETSKPGDVLAVDVDGIVHPDRPGLDDNLAWLAEHTTPRG
jgi:malate dehydrogenase (oxaloacetate-decarboxylating)